MARTAMDDRDEVDGTDTGLSTESISSVSSTAVRALHRHRHSSRTLVISPGVSGVPVAGPWYKPPPNVVK